MPSLIYIASPYSHDDKQVEAARADAASQLTAELIRRGDFAFSPIAYTHPLAVEYGLPGDFEFWRKFDERMIQHCDAVVVVCMRGWSTSKGVQAEIEFARLIGREVLYWTSDNGFQPEPPIEREKEEPRET